MTERGGTTFNGAIDGVYRQDEKGGLRTTELWRRCTDRMGGGGTTLKLLSL